MLSTLSTLDAPSDCPYDRTVRSSLSRLVNAFPRACQSTSIQPKFGMDIRPNDRLLLVPPPTRRRRSLWMSSPYTHPRLLPGFSCSAAGHPHHILPTRRISHPSTALTARCPRRSPGWPALQLTSVQWDDCGAASDAGSKGTGGAFVSLRRADWCLHPFLDGQRPSVHTPAPTVRLSTFDPTGGRRQLT